MDTDRDSINTLVGKEIAKVEKKGMVFVITFTDCTKIRVRLHDLFDACGNWFKEAVE